MNAVSPLIADVFALLCLAVGLFFMIVGAIGTVRMPDAYNRLHAATKCSTLGLLGLLLAAVFYLGEVGVLIRAVLTMLFIFVSNPVGAHLLAKAALAVRTPQWPGTLSDDHARDFPHDAEPNLDPVDAQPEHADSGSRR